MILKNNGYQFVEFISLEEEEMDQFPPISGSFAIVESEGRYLLCYNDLRTQWELPAGKKEKGETSRECAARELFEETGQQVDDLRFEGLMVKKSADGRLKYNPVFNGELEKLLPFIENYETSEIMLWDFKGPIGTIDEVDYKLLLEWRKRS